MAQPCTYLWGLAFVSFLYQSISISQSVNKHSVCQPALTNWRVQPSASGHVLGAQEVQAAAANRSLSVLAQCRAATISTASSNACQEYCFVCQCDLCL
jgi:hypothetical protein